MFKKLAIILTLSSAFTCLSTSSYSAETIHQPPHQVIERIEKEIGIIDIIGEIDDNSADIVHKGFHHFKTAGISYVIIHLNSLGGKITDGTFIINDILDAEEHGVTVVTYVDHKDYCASMCTGIFAVGSDRMAAPDTIWIFHAPYAKLTSDEENDPQIMKEVQEATKEAEEYMLSIYSKADPEWTENVLKDHITQPGNDLIITGADIIAQHTKWILMPIYY